MPFRFTFSVHSDEATTVPYGPIRDSIRHNRGFVDLRRQPERAKEIAEGKISPALRNLLIRLAEADSLIFTLGCNLGSHTESTHVPRRRREVAGGYVQIASISYQQTKTDAYAAFANFMVDELRARCGQDIWKTDIVGKWVNFKFQGEQSGVHPSLWIWFFAAAEDPFSAIESRERLIASVCETFVMPRALELFTLAKYKT